MLRPPLHFCRAGIAEIRLISRLTPTPARLLFRPALLKVFLVTGSSPPLRCGVGDYTASLAQSLRDSEQAQVAILTGDPEARAQSGIELILIRGWRLARAFEALRAAAAWKPDIVHMQFPTPGYRSGCLPWALPLLLRLAVLHIAQTSD